MKLKGHADNVKTVILNGDGTECLSGSSDGTIKLWSLGQQRCLATYRIHDEGVWTLASDEHLSYFYSSGKDRKVFFTDLAAEYEKSYFLFQEKAPVLSIQPSYDPKCLWVATTESDLNCWPIDIQHESMEEEEDSNPLVDKPCETIAGGAGIKRVHILNNKRHVITEDSNGDICLWDILKAKKLQQLGKVDFDEEIRKRKEPVYIPNWFTVDAKTGMLNVTLEESDCFAGWMVLDDVNDLQPLDRPAGTQGEPRFVNYGLLLLQALLEYWPETHIAMQSDVEAEVDNDQEDFQVNGSDKRTRVGGRKTPIPLNRFFSIPPHTPLVFTEGFSCGRTLFRLAVGDAVGENECSILADTVPQWVLDVTVKHMQPKFNKIAFHLIPFSANGLKNNNRRDRLSASDMIHVRKVMEHVYEKVVLADNASSTSSQSSERQNSQSKICPEEVEIASLAEAKVELYCNDVILDPNMDLRTVQNMIWRSKSDLTLQYKLLKDK